MNGNKGDSMKKIVLVDGNNLLFRSYYATAYSGNFMKNSKGFPTNGLYGFVNMINKIINDEKPEYILVAFDKGKTFRHDKYEEYNAGRIQMPDELKLQFPIAKKILEALGIRWFEIDNYEADDIIGTLSNEIDEKDGIYEALIVSSDKDLLQLISDNVTVKLLKTKDHIMMTPETFKENSGIEPINMIDLKALQGDPSDNIPGVKGIGEKTAIKLLQEYKTVEGIYENIESIKGANKQKLIDDKEKAFESKDLVTIYKNVPLGFHIEDTKKQEMNLFTLKVLYEDLEFYSFLKNINIEKKEDKIDIIEIKCIEDLKILNSNVAIYIEIDNTNYHKSNILGMGIFDGINLLYVNKFMTKDALNYINNFNKYTYDLKKHYVISKKIGIQLDNVVFDSNIAAYLLNYNVKDDIAYLANDLNYDIAFYEVISKSKELDKDLIKNLVCKKAKFIYETKDMLEKQIIDEECNYLFNEIEMPLSIILAEMEYEGIRVDKKILEEMGIQITKKIDDISNKIYELAGEIFNIASPKQLGEILFEKLEIGKGKKTKSGYSTDKAVLEKYKDRHEIVPYILEHRMFSKLYSTYIVGLENAVSDDGKIHTIYTQTLTRTGRLSSIEPNLQNLPARTEYGRLIRKAFIPEENSVLLSSDYSQIELRVFAHFSKVESWLDAFNNDKDIHTRTAMDIFGVNEENVTSLMRRQAKAVNFGILYGISNFGLAEDLQVDVKEAKKFIDRYFETYSGTKIYMDEVIKNAYEKGFVSTIMNRKRKIDELKNTNYMIRQQGERMALNTPIQGSAADILKKAMVDIFREFKKENIRSKMLLQVHDELIFNVYNDELEKVKKIVDKCMDNAYQMDVPLKVDIQIGKNWYEAK